MKHRSHTFILSLYNDTDRVYVPQREGREHTVSKYSMTADLKPSGQIPKSASPCLMSKKSSELQLFYVIDCNALLSAGLFPPLVCSFSWQVFYVSVIPMSWGLQGSLDSIIIASRKPSAGLHARTHT